MLQNTGATKKTKDYEPDDLDYQMLEDEAAGKNRLLQIFCLIEVGLTSFSVLSLLIQTLFGVSIAINVIITNVLILLFEMLNYWWAKTGHFKLSSWLLVLSSLLAITAGYIAQGLNTSLLVAFLLPIVLAVILLDNKAVFLTLGVGVVTNLSLHIVVNLLKIYTPAIQSNETNDVTDAFIALVVIPGLVALIILPLQAQTKSLKRQNGRLRQLLAKLEERQQAGQRVSQNVLELSTVLSSNASQQAASSQQQLAAITQINASMSELAASASQITNLTQHISEAINSMAMNSQAIENTTSLSAQQSQEGKLAVDNTILATEEMAELYHNLTQTLNELTLKTINSRRILELIGSIANETHLLSLNAAIEAAGAGVYGERFSIVAQEVKNLASRAKQAGQEVVEVVNAIEFATTQSMEVVEEGFQKAQKMKEIVRLAGTTIDKMQQVAEQAQHQSIEVNQFTQEVKNQVDVVRQVTYQQHSASQQVLRALPDLSIVAHQNAEGSASISEMVINLEQVSSSLVGTLES